MSINIFYIMEDIMLFLKKDSSMPQLLSSQCLLSSIYYLRLLWWLSGKASACNAGHMGLIPGLGRSPGGGHGNPFQYLCLQNPMDMIEVTEHARKHLLLNI